MSVLIIHESPEPTKDKTAELIARAVKMFKDNVQDWRHLAQVTEIGIEKGQMLCLNVAEDYKKLVSLRSRTNNGCAFDLVCNELGKTEKGVNFLSWKTLQNAKFALLPEVHESNDSEVEITDVTEA